jgi:hypothetical protein
MARPEVQRLLVTYTVDLIRVLRELFDLMLQPQKALTAATWEDLKEAFEAYERSLSRQHNHRSIHSEQAWGRRLVTVDNITEKVHDLVGEN